MLPAPPPVAVVARASAPYPNLLPPDVAADQCAWIEQTARWLAEQQSADGDELVERLCSAAIGEWRLHHAALWQRARFRARFIRATSRDNRAAKG